MISSKKTTSFFNPKLATEFHFSDQGWARPGDARFDPKFEYLAHRLCAVGDKFYVKNPRDGAWEEVSNKSQATARVYQEHGGMQSLHGVQQIISLDDIKAFFAVGIVHFKAVTYAPGMPDFLWFNGERRLNVYLDRRIDGITDNIEHVEEFLKVIRNSLCDAPDEIGLVEMIDEIMGTEHTPFRWVIHWLAARYQMPGFCPQTNLWFCGARGTGKGSIMAVMRQIMGPKSVGKIDASDIARGWTTSLFGAEILEWDEFKGNGWHDFNRFIKEKTGNQTYAATQRNVGDVLHPNVAFHMFSTNDPYPIFVEKDDRQNTFLKTNGTDEWKSRAKGLWTPTGELVDDRIVTGFAALLNNVTVDIGFIKTPLITALKTSLASHFDDDTIVQWIESVKDNSVGWETPSWEDLHREYRAYCQNHTSSKPVDLKAFKAGMKDGDHAKECVGKKRMSDGSRKSVRFIKLAIFDTNDNEDEGTVTPLFDRGAA